MKRRKVRRGHYTAPRTNELQRIYLIILLLQPFQLASRNGEVKKRSRDPFHQEDIRRCVVCSAPVDNPNLGGHSGKSAMSGRLWCLHCC